MTEGEFIAHWGPTSLFHPDARDEMREDLRKLVASAVEECCKAVCPDCASGVPIGQKIDGTWVHLIPESYEGVPDATEMPCDASAIRSRAAKPGEVHNGNR